MWGYDIEYAGELAEDYDIYIIERPDVPVPEIDREQITIPGRDGDLYMSDKTVKDIQIHINMNFMTEPDRWGEKFREAKAWLLGNQTGILRLSDDQEWFYRVKKVSIGTSERTCKEIGKFQAVFVCSGYTYREDGATSHTIEDVKRNNWEKCQPIYVIKGDANCTLTVNGKPFKVNVGQKCRIDTERQLTYRDDGQLANADVKGDYEDLYLQGGENTIEITPGVALEIIPNWRSY